jgi:penicillin-binding protein 2
MQTLSTRKTQSWLSWFARGILLLGTLFLIGRLIELQVIKGAYYRDLADGNRIRRVPISAPRGKILAKNGEVLATNKQINKAIVFNPETGYEKKEIYNPNDNSEIISESVRYYPLGEITAHVTGYVGKTDEDELGKTDPNCLEKGIKNGEDYTGRTGLEEQYDCELRGIDGEMLIEVDTTGKTIRVLAKKNPITGSDIKTSLNLGLQRKIAGLMAGKPGAVITSGAKGEVLAMYSSPSYDPNIFIEEDQDELTRVLKDGNLPLFNRALSGLYHPGSTFKPVVAIAALENDKIDENFTFDDTGSIVVNEYSYNNWFFTQYGQTEGNINLVRAIARSTDTFFYKVGEILGVESLADWAKKFKLAEASGIDLPGESVGLIPDPAWKLRVKSEPWYLGNTYHMSIGQGDLLVTPLALNAAITTIASNGNFCQPHLAKEQNCTELNLQQKNLDLVKRGMISACQTGGTGYTFFDSNPVVACKTGTAETMKKDITHAWFTFIAPAAVKENDVIKIDDNPEIITTVLVEEGGEGSKVAGPIAREIFNYWFGIKSGTFVEEEPQ